MQALIEWRRPVANFTVGIHNETATVKDEFILTTDHVDIQNGDACLLNTIPYNLFTLLLAIAFVGRSVDRNDTFGSGRSCRGKRPRLPDVFTDRDTNRNAVESEHRRVLAAPEISFLIEDTVIRQQVFAISA